MGKFIAFVMLMALIATPIGTLYLLSSHTKIEFAPPPKVIGGNTPITVHVANPHGLRRFTAILEQNGASTTIFETKTPPDRIKFWLAQFPDQDIHFNAGSKQDPNLKEGKARLEIEAQSNDFRGATGTISADVDVVLRPPSVSADGFQHYINQGGSEMVFFTPSGYWTEAGVRVGNDTFRSFPYTRQHNRALLSVRLSLGYAARHRSHRLCEKPGRHGSHRAFWFKVFPKKFRMRDLQIDDKFLDKVVNQIEPNGSGDLLTRFLKINGEMRRANNNRR